MHPSRASNAGGSTIPAFNLKEYVNAWNTHSVEKVLEHYAEESELVDPTTPHAVRGKSAIRQNVQGYLKAFPDLNADVVWSVEKEGKIAAITNVTGTHTGELELDAGRKVPPTSKRVSYRLGWFAEVDANGKIKRETNVADMAGVFAQLGLTPEKIASLTSTARPGTPPPRR